MSCTTKMRPSIGLLAIIIIAIVCIGKSSGKIAAEFDEYAAKTKRPPPIPIVKQSFAQHAGGYQFSYETGNGIHTQEVGFIKQDKGDKEPIFVQKGSVTYHDEHGLPITLTYIADEHGFRPQGAHLPTPPPIPHDIQKTLHAADEQPQFQDAHNY